MVGAESCRKAVGAILVRGLELCGEKVNLTKCMQVAKQEDSFASLCPGDSLQHAPCRQRLLFRLPRGRRLGTLPSKVLRSSARGSGAAPHPVQGDWVLNSCWPKLLLSSCHVFSASRREWVCSEIPAPGAGERQGTTAAELRQDQGAKSEKRQQVWCWMHSWTAVSFLSQSPRRHAGPSAPSSPATPRRTVGTPGLGSGDTKGSGGHSPPASLWVSTVLPRD